MLACLRGWRTGQHDAVAIHIGTSGWSYDHWDGALYPAGTPPRDRLGIYVQHFDTVELNASCYRWPADRTFASWRERLPAGFELSVKAPPIPQLVPAPGNDGGGNAVRNDWTMRAVLGA